MFNNFISIISTLITLYIARNNIFTPKKISVYEKQLYNVYLPLFKYIEPYLYKEDVPIDVITTLIYKFDFIKDNHYELIDSKLLNDFLLLKNSINLSTYNYSNYESFCYTLSNLFEKCRRRLALPTRNIIYKLNNKQCTRSTRILLEQLKQIIIQCFGIILLGLVILITLNFFKSVWSFILKTLLSKL